MISSSFIRAYSLGRQSPTLSVPPPTPIAIIHDNFNGSTETSLLSHTPDIIGGSWIDFISVEYPGFDADMFWLDGAGNVVLNTNYYSWADDGAVYNSTTSTVSNFTIEADLAIVQEMQASYQFFLLFKGDPVDNGGVNYDSRFSQMELFVNTDGSVSYVGLGSYYDEGNGIYNLDLEPVDPVDVSTGTHALKLVVNNLLLSLYYDNVLIAQRTASILSTGTHFGFTMRTNDDVGRVGFSNFKVSEN